jgi:hypothetical protein
MTVMAAVAITWISGCAGMAPQTESVAAVGGVSSDTLGRNAIPIGFGSLHQDDLSFHLDAGGFLVRALPLLMVTSNAQDFHPYDLIPLTTGFSEQRIHQRETQNALYLFDGDIQLDQPITVSYEGIQDNSWDQTLQHIERERAMVRARAGQAQ